MRCPTVLSVRCVGSSTAPTAAMPPSMAGRAGSHRSPSAGSSANRSPGSAAARCSSQGHPRVDPRRRRRRWRRWAGCGADRLRCDRHGQVLNELSRPAPTRCRRARRRFPARGAVTGTRRTRAASRPPATAQGCRQGAGIVALKSALRPARAVLKVAGPRTSPWMIYWRRGSSRDGVLSRPRRGRFRPVPGHGLVSAKPKAPPASAFTAATEYSRPR